MRRSSFLVLMAFASLALSVRASASVVEALSLDDLVHESEQVVVATAVSAHSRWDGSDRIVTDVTLTVSDAMKGRSRVGDSLVVTHLGGAVDGIGMRVEGAPHFTVGEAHLVFAGRLRERLVPIGLSQGVMRIAHRDGRRFVQPGGSGLALVSRTSSGALLRAAPAVMHERDLDDVVSEIRAVVAAEAAR